MDGTVDHDDPPGCHPGKRSVVAAKDLVDVGVTNHAEAQHIRRGTE